MTGGAGTGKSFLVRRYLGHLQSHIKGRRSATKDLPILASTGAAAVLIGGRTFHSFFGLGILEGGVAATVDRAAQNRSVIARLRRAQGFILDEVSMLSGQTLRAAETIARRVRDNDRPWGGLRVIAVGDFAQLPPVEGGRNEALPVRSDGRRDWAFQDESWTSSLFAPALLREHVRSTDSRFLQVLELVREGTVTSVVRDFLESRRPDGEVSRDVPRLFPRRDTTERYNLDRLAELKGQETVIETLYSGETPAREALKRQAPIPEVLRLKEGALVMLRVNEPSGKYVNGSLGTVLKVTPARLTIELQSGRTVELEKQGFYFYSADGEAKAGAINFPVVLAWATTIHKSQGATLDRLVVDLTRLWEPGQAYVALSRLRSSDGLHLTGWSPQSIRADQDVLEFYDQLFEATALC